MAKKKKVTSNVVTNPTADTESERLSERAMRLSANMPASKPTTEENFAKRESREMSLYDYQAEIAAIETFVREAEGEITDEQYDKLMALYAGSIVKLKSYVWVIRRVNDSCTAIDAEIDRLSALKKYRKNVQDRLEAALVRYILETQPEKRQIDLDTYIISAKKNPPSIEVDEGFFDPFYSDIKSIKNPSAETIDAAKANGDELVIQPNKKAIKEAIDQGETVPGARLIDNKYKLNIK